MSTEKLLLWDIYEIKSEKVPLHGVMLRGRIRKLGLEQGFNVLCENASDAENCVRFGVTTPEAAAAVGEWLAKVNADITVQQVAAGMPNPVLSKLKVNKEERYEL